MNLDKFGPDDHCIKVYNPLEKKLIAVYSSPQKAGNRLGLTGKVIANRCITKARIFAPLLNLEVAIRSSFKTPEDDKLIEQTLKKRILNT